MTARTSLSVSPRGRPSGLKGARQKRRVPTNSVHLFNCRPTGTGTWGSSWHASFWHAASACSLVDFHHNGVYDSFKLLLFSLKFILLGQLVLVKPIKSLLHCSFNLLFVSRLELVLQLLLLECVAHGKTIVLESILGFNLCPIALVLCPVLLCFLNHSVDLGLGQTTLLIRDRDLVRFA